MNKEEREEAKLLTNQILAAADDEFFRWLIVHVHTEANLRCIALPCEAGAAYIPKNEPDEDIPVVAKVVSKPSPYSSLADKLAAKKTVDVNKDAILTTEKQLDKKADWTSPLMMPKCKKKAYNQIALHIPKGAFLKHTDHGGLSKYFGYAVGFTKYFVKVKTVEGITKKVKYSHIVAVDFNSIVIKKK